MLTIQEFLFQDKIKALKISNGSVELVCSLSFGPRILFFGFCGGKNMFRLDQPQLEESRPDNIFRLVGGHRLWTAPEDLITTYLPDNRPLTWEQKEGTVYLRMDANDSSPLEKEIEIKLHPALAIVELTHRITNRGDWSLTFAPWALSVMAPGGTAILPLPPRGTHLDYKLPNGSLIFWPYTNFSDPRWQPGFEFIRLIHDSSIKNPFKIGLAAEVGWLAYANFGHLFYKEAPIISGAKYPDMGTNAQIYLDGNFTELETLGPLELVKPAKCVTHQETWLLLDGIKSPTGDQDIRDIILPKVRALLN